jgi:hypothetical protein
VRETLPLRSKLVTFSAPLTKRIAIGFHHGRNELPMTVLKLTGPAPLLTGRQPTSWSPSHIDLAQLRWATPFDIVALAVIWTRLVEAGATPTIDLPQDAAVRAQLVGEGLADVIDAEWGAGGPTSTESPLIRLVRLDSPEDWDFLTADLWTEVNMAIDDTDLVRRTFDILGELIDNAGTHGKSSTGTFVCVQRHDGEEGSGQPALWLGVADGGRGIPSHLRLNPKYKDISADERLIQLARKPWVTGTRDQRGWGLVEVFEEASAAGVSEMLIRSGRGEGYFKLRAAARPYAMYRRLRPKIPGTWIHLKVGIA